MRGLTRRSLLKGGAALVALHASRLLSPSAAAASAKPRVAVVGAGAFGGWTALHLVRRGARVVLLDAWGPGNSRASSGGETRVIRATYGPRPDSRSSGWRRPRQRPGILRLISQG